MDITIMSGIFCVAMVAIVAITSRNNGGNSPTANKAIDALKNIFGKDRYIH